MRHILLFLFMIISPQFIQATEQEDSLITATRENQTVKEVRRDTTIRRREKIHQYGGIIKRVIKAFDDTDTSYIVRPKYNWQVSMKSNYSEEWFKLRNQDTRQSVMFRSRSGIKFGPHLGWRWLSAGYDMEVASFGNGQKYRKTQFNFSVYSSMIGFDALYRRTGSDYAINSMKGFTNLNREDFIGRENNGVQVSLTGLNVYYVLNHKKYSQSSAFANSMREQKRSAGSWKFGANITKHDIRFNKDTLMRELGMQYERSGQYLRKMRYWDFSIYAGYGYNWVFARHWLLGVDVEPALGYKRTNSEIWRNPDEYKNENDDDKSKEWNKYPAIYRAFLERGNLNVNIIGRAALAWNNGHYFGGMTLVFYNFNYRHQNMSAHNTFFTLSAYIGLNFMERKRYRMEKAGMK